MVHQFFKLHHAKIVGTGEEGLEDVQMCFRNSVYNMLIFMRQMQNEMNDFYLYRIHHLATFVYLIYVRNMVKGPYYQLPYGSI